MTEKYNIIIIGSGLGDLVCANTLSKVGSIRIGTYVHR